MSRFSPSFLILSLIILAGCESITEIPVPIDTPFEAVTQPAVAEPIMIIPEAAPVVAGIGGDTFGDAPACSLLSGEQVAAAFGEPVYEIDYEAGIGCRYLNQYGLALLLVNYDSGAGIECGSPDGTYLGNPVEQVDGLGERAIWVDSLETLCVLQSDSRVQIYPVSSSAHFSDQRSLAIELAHAAVVRLP
jgi:hypothetical protein